MVFKSTCSQGLKPAFLLAVSGRVEAIPFPEPFMTRFLVPVFVGEVSPQIRFELAVIGMNGRAQGRFGGTALAQSFENALHIAHAVRIVDVRDGSQTFGISDRGLDLGEAREAPLQHIQGNVLLCLEELSEGMTIAAKIPGLKKLG